MDQWKIVRCNLSKNLTTAHLKSCAAPTKIVLARGEV